MPRSDAHAQNRNPASALDPTFAHVLHKVRPTVQRAVARILGASHPELDDATQEALLAFLAAWGAFRGECHPSGYAARIAVREAIRVRQRARLRQRRTRELGERRDADERATAGHDDRDPLRCELLLSLLAELPPAQREALVQRSVVGLSLEEVSTLSGAPLNTVRSRIRLAREAMQLLIRACPDLADEAARLVRA